MVLVCLIRRAVALVVWVYVIAYVLFFATAHADTIPHEAKHYRLDLTRQARQVWGLDAPVATFAAQIHTESRWQPGASSPVGARGMTQFMPATEQWIKRLDPKLNTPREQQGLGEAQGETTYASPWGATNPVWAMRALVVYDRWLLERVSARDGCERMAMALSSYNGGLGWLQRDVAATPSGLRLRWFDGVERYNAGRSNAAWHENRAYPRLILKVREPIYINAGWGAGSC